MSNNNKFAFIQPAPRIGNTYVEDSIMRSSLARLTRASPSRLEPIEGDLCAFGDRCINDLRIKANECEEHEPTLRSYDEFGENVNFISTSIGWKQQHVAAAEEKLINLAYQDLVDADGNLLPAQSLTKFDPYSRLHQICKLSMYTPSSGMYSCPLAMTDGSARLMYLLLCANNDTANPKHTQVGVPGMPATSKPYADESLQHLTSSFASDPLRDRPSSLHQPVPPKHPHFREFWTAGQWMTEQASGSDVSYATGTVAVMRGDGSYSLYGVKWFTSAIDAEMAITLARIVNKETWATAVALCNKRQGTDRYSQKPVPRCVSDPEHYGGGSAHCIDDLNPMCDIVKAIPLTCFYVRVRENGVLNGINVQKLKVKLGTKQLPTAELVLNNTHAHRLSQPNRGIAVISQLFNVTRIHNSASAVGYMRRMVSIVRDYSHRRFVFGSKLSENALHLNTLATLQATHTLNSNSTLELGLLQGIVESCESFLRHIGSHGSRDMASLSPQQRKVVSDGLVCIVDACVSVDIHSTALQQHTLTTVLNDFKLTTAVTAELLERTGLALRILTPMCKLFTAKEAMRVASECVEAMGALGFMEDSRIPRIMRDTQVLSIWEGTTNVCSHDVIRVLTQNARRKSGLDVLDQMGSMILNRLRHEATTDVLARATAAHNRSHTANVHNADLSVMFDSCIASIKESWSVVIKFIAKAGLIPSDTPTSTLSKNKAHLFIDTHARALSLTMFRVFALSSLVSLVSHTLSHDYDQACAYIYTIWRLVSNKPYSNTTTSSVDLSSVVEKEILICASLSAAEVEQRLDMYTHINRQLGLDVGKVYGTELVGARGFGDVHPHNPEAPRARL